MRTLGDLEKLLFFYDKRYPFRKTFSLLKWKLSRRDLRTEYVEVGSSQVILLGEREGVLSCKLRMNNIIDLTMYT